jgi:RNA polymerase sigma-70 factor (ECF subfamily)
MQSGNGYAFSLPGSPELLPGRRLLSETSWKNMTEDSTEFAGKTVANNDLELVHATKNGDVSAFEQLVKRYDRKLFRIAEGVTHNTEDAQDAVQEAFFKAFQNLDKFREESQFSTWLIRITVNESLMKLRKQPSTREVSLDDSSTDGNILPIEVTDWAPNPEQLYWAYELRAILLNALTEMPPILRIVFVIRDIEGLSIDQTAEVLNLSQVAVKARLWRARLHLRERLTKYFGETKQCSRADLIPKGKRTGRILAFVAECLDKSISSTLASHVAKSSRVPPIGAPANALDGATGARL